MLTTTVFGAVSFLTFTVFKHSVITCNDIKVIKEAGISKVVIYLRKVPPLGVSWKFSLSQPDMAPRVASASNIKLSSNSRSPDTHRQSAFLHPFHAMRFKPRFCIVLRPQRIAGNRKYTVKTAKEPY